MVNNLRVRASKNFDKYLQDFLSSGVTKGLPSKRLSEQEWKTLNAEVRQYGVMLVPVNKDGKLHYWFATYAPLRVRASKNFDKYLHSFLAVGENNGLPSERLSEQEWNQLNTEIKRYGVKLVLKERNGKLGYWFEKYDKGAGFATGKNRVENSLIELVSKKYPGVPKDVILDIIRAKDSLTVDDIYHKIRYKQNGQYTDVSPHDFESAAVYALESVGNPKNGPKFLNMYSSQEWWFRECKAVGKSAPINDVKFHISLNVKVVKELLIVLDDILMTDGGRYIRAYKIPQKNCYDEVLTRHDIVTIYTKARNPELEQKIINAVAPFVRSDDGIIGEKLGRGVCVTPETSNTNGLSVGDVISGDILNMIRQYNVRA